MPDIWTWTIDEEGVCWAEIDVPERSVNTLDRDVLSTFADALTVIERHAPKGLVIGSGKPAGFMAGADMGALETLDKTQLRQLIVDGKALLDRIESLDFPTVCMIHGHCMGGGLEVALACDRRIARNDSTAGLPEIRLGLVPGLAGTRRLPETIGITEAMPLILSGKTLSADKARRLGLFDEVVPARHLRAAARAALSRGRTRGRKGLSALRDKALQTRIGRRFLARQMRKKTEEKVDRRHYPAPFRLIDAFEEHGLGDAFEVAETDIFVDLAFDPSSLCLRRVFKLREMLKKRARCDQESMKIKRVHVIGAGAMGGEVAAWTALHGFEASLTDVDPEPIAKAVKQAHTLFDTERAQSRGDLRPPRNLLIPDPKGNGARRADLVFEAAPEKLSLKKKLFSDIEPGLSPDAIIATNTSSLTLKDMGRALDRPQRLVGLHFFNPVSKMPLVEVVSANASDPDAARRVAGFAEAIGKLPVPCRDSPGFIVNRALTPYLLEAARIKEEGIEPALIDALAEDFGMAQGPVEVADSVGLDIALDVARQLQKAFPDQVGTIPPDIESRVEAGYLGRKAGHGFYVYGEDGKPEKERAKPADLDDAQRARMTDRLILPLLNACAACLREGVADDADLIDAALIFGAGFAPFRGGPLCYARSRGVAEIVAALEALRDTHQDKRFEPDPGWQDLIA